MFRYLIQYVIAVFLLLFSNSMVFAAAITVPPSNSGTYIVQGNNMDGVSGIELNITYDISTLASPTVTKGSLIGDALFAANTNIPGTIKIAIISTTSFSGSGPIATVSFATHKGTSSITITSANMIDSKALPVTAETGSSSSTTGFISSPGIPFNQQNSATTAITPAAGSTGALSTSTPPASSTPVYLGTVSLPSDALTKSEVKSADTTSAPHQPTESASAEPTESPAEKPSVSEANKSKETVITSYRGTLDNFRAYQGAKTPDMFIALFKKEIAPNIHQQPAIALSDGKTLLKIVVKLKSNSDKSPNFALNGAKLVSVHRDDASLTWMIEALPQAGVIQAGLTILTDTDIIEYPLTLAPPINGFSPSKTNFIAFTKNNGPVNPKKDTNSDGRHDYLDDYIYTANYLVRKEATANTKK